jgi:hypothetical protein
MKDSFPNFAQTLRNFCLRCNVTAKQGAQYRADKARQTKICRSTRANLRSEFLSFCQRGAGIDRPYSCDGRALYCFSPLVMLATFGIEIILAIVVFVRHRATRFGKTAGFVLILLAVFQFAEYRICTAEGALPVLWSRVGFVAITLLPLMGLYLVSLVSHKPHFLKLGYLSAAAFVVYFIFVPKAITGAICAGNYVIFNTSNDLYRLYGFYYLGFLLLGIWESVEKIASLKRRTTSKRALQWLIVGYLSFMAPMGLAYITFPVTRNAVASIMCGFALTLAFILAFKVVPVFNRTHHSG